MKIYITSLIISFISLISLGCFVVPPEYVVLEASPHSDYFIRKINSQHLVEVRKCKDMSLAWKRKIHEYNELFSIIRLSPNGKYLIHIKGNHLIHSKDQVCVEIYESDGSKTTFDGIQMKSTIVKSDSIDSITPPYRWFNEVSDISDAGIAIKLDEKKSAWINFRSKKVEIHQ